VAHIVGMSESGQQVCNAGAVYDRSELAAGIECDAALDDRMV